MMDVFNSLSCCMDCSKDVAETSVELVICNCAATKTCCVRWETFTYVAAVLFSAMDFTADLFSYVSFTNTIPQDELTPINIYVYVWFTFMIISGVLLLSEVTLPIYCIVLLHKYGEVEDGDEKVDKLRTTAKYWSRVNSFAVILSEDGIIALARILIAFKSVSAIEELQAPEGQIASVVACAVTLLRHCLFIMQIIVKLGHNNINLNRCPSWDEGKCTKSFCGLYAFFFTILFISCCALAATGMSMLISLDAIKIKDRDNVDFLMNVSLIGLFITGSYIISAFIICITRW